MLVARCELVQHDRKRAAKSRPGRRVYPGLDPKLADTFAQLFYNSIFLGAVQVLIDNWDKAFAFDPEVDKLLRRRAMRDAVKEFRNSLFHNEPLVDEENVRSRGRLVEMVDWGDQVLAATKAYLKALHPVDK